MTAGHDHFVATHTVIGTAPLVPEIRLHLASAITPIWQASEDWLAARNLAPPFWAFAWPGSQALARHVLDHPALVAGRRVLDFAAGGGLAAIACALAGAASVDAAEIDPLADAAIRLNTALNGAALNGASVAIAGNVMDQPHPNRWDLILCGDVCYDAAMTGQIMPWLRHMARTAEVWLAEPGRHYRPQAGMTPFASYRVPTSLELEDRTEREVALLRVAADAQPA